MFSGKSSSFDVAHAYAVDDSADSASQQAVVHTGDVLEFFTALSPTASDFAVTDDSPNPLNLNFTLNAPLAADDAGGDAATTIDTGAPVSLSYTSNLVTAQIGDSLTQPELPAQPATGTINSAADANTAAHADLVVNAAPLSVAFCAAAPAIIGNVVAAQASAVVEPSINAVVNPAGTGNTAETTDSATGSTIAATGATPAQVQQAIGESGLSVDGTGVKVGVLSNSFNDLGGAAADEASGALPATVTVLKDLPSGGDDEGRAMLQVVHDIAPGASLYFYTAAVSEQDFANGILALAAAGCKVICDDVFYYDEPFFQNGIVAQAIQTVEQEGVCYLTLAGNNASNAYQAAWTPIASTTANGVALKDTQNFGNGSPVQTITVGADSTYSKPLVLEWNQAYGSATSNLEILVFNQVGTLIATATNSSSGEPTNPWVEVNLQGGATYYIAIENLSGPDPGLIKEIWLGNGIPATISGANVGTVYGHEMTPGAITVGAVSTASTPAFGVSPPLSESFSSSGLGTELLFANNGAALSSPELLNPVAVSGVDDIHTTLPPPPPPATGGLYHFLGTSCATPTVAAVAALLLEANPNLTPAQVDQILQDTALPMANSAVSGAGLVQADAAVMQAAVAEDDLVNVLFQGIDTSGQRGLWVTNGTAAGTHEVTGISGASSSGINPNYFTALNGEVLFAGNDASGQRGLWLTNGTAAGTHEVTGISYASSGGISPSDLTEFNGKVLFEGIDASSLYELWVTDGTAAGTQELLPSGSVPLVGYNGVQPLDLTVFGSEVLFSGVNTTGQRGLWITNGTYTSYNGSPPEGAQELTGISGASSSGLNPSYLTALNGDVLFDGFDASGQYGLWVTNGTAAGTHELTGISGADSNGLDPTDLTGFNGEALFNGINASAQGGLWVTDGTVAGTYEVTGISGANKSGLGPNDLTVFNGEVLFSGHDASGQFGLWVSNGTASGTYELTGISGAYSKGLEPTDLTVFNGEVLFQGLDSSGQYGLWVTDGTAAGTHELTGISGVYSGSSLGLYPIGFTPALVSVAMSNDFFGYGTSDVVLENGQTTAVWELNGTSILSGSGTVGTLGTGWSVVGTGAFSGSGQADLLLQNGQQLAIWEMDGKTILPSSGGIGTLSTGWSVAGTGDFNGNGYSDILLQNGHQLALWEMDGTQIQTGSGNIGTLGAGWSVAGKGDFNGDGTTDILLKNGQQLAIWEMNGTTILPGSGNIGTLGTGWSVAGVGDFNGDGHADILLKNGQQLAIWEMNGTTILPGSGGIGTLAAGWSVAGVGDYNGDGHADILLQNGQQLAVWEMNGTSIIGGGIVGTLATGWATSPLV